MSKINKILIIFNIILVCCTIYYNHIYRGSVVNYKEAADQSTCISREVLNIIEGKWIIGELVGKSLRTAEDSTEKHRYTGKNLLLNEENILRLETIDDTGEKFFFSYIIVHYITLSPKELNIYKDDLVFAGKLRLSDFDKDIVIIYADIDKCYINIDDDYYRLKKRT